MLNGAAVLMHHYVLTVFTFMLLLSADLKQVEEKHAVREAAILKREQELSARSEQLAVLEGKLQVCAQ